jgi:uncharacterized protein (DUF1499 family)
MTVIKIVAFALVLIVGVVFFTLQRNDANLFQTPGFQQRLTTFLTTNIAETSDDHPFEELRTPVFNVGAKKLYERVLYVAAESGWNVLSHDSDNQNANFVVRTPVFLFEDDVFVQVQFINMDESSLYIRSSSRKGGADLAANSGHIQELIRKIKE